ncbi:cell division protein ZapA [Limibacterium fermenti]|jgi:cell division protein ZapA|uniref:cell division protein ZapA n=1 Tax=Limibacterium fermenti TaxID=3229863 RepID=UPI000E8614BE|nr:cell division protein ZapA [Porphyromonadaceae bacterium]HBX21672.1 cell division protein ZapA [Porphyromonadaceae bacterium]HBX44408.1 cell division protein ZapA [Porphyromonadaceae bacterium]HCM21227.1 cell division protein ZapA [Porphyromonadaceae bacterium]
MGDEKFLLTLTIDGRKYPLKIHRSEEQAFRDAAKKINTKINQYRVAFGGTNSGMTPQDFIAMTAIQALVENFSLEDKNDTKPFKDKIHSLINELDTYLSE